MKNKAVTRLLKQIVEALASVTKAKSVALSLKSKMSDIKARVTIFSLLYLNKQSLLGTIRPNKLRAAFLSHHRNLQQELNGGEDQDQISNHASEVLYQCISNIGDDATVANHVQTKSVEEEAAYGCYQIDGEEEEEDNKDNVEGEEGDKNCYLYDDLAQSLLEEMGFKDHDAGTSAMALVRDSKEEEEGEGEGEGDEYFRLEDRIDEVAELFINRFHQQIRMQKQNSLKESLKDINL